jgi:hypothetical protein
LLKQLCARRRPVPPLPLPTHMATAKAMPQRLASEAARGALLAAHAATGLSGGVSPQATRLLRAAEGILRSAIAVLAVPPVLDVAQSVVAPLAPPRRRRPRRKRSGKGIGKDDVDGDAGMGVELQGSVGVGDGAGASSAVLSVAAVGVGAASSGLLRRRMALALRSLWAPLAVARATGHHGRGVLACSSPWAARSRRASSTRWARASRWFGPQGTRRRWRCRWTTSRRLPLRPARIAILMVVRGRSPLGAS